MAAPVFDEAGVRDYEFNTWYGVLTAAKTPVAVIEQLNREMARIAEAAAVREQFTPQGIEATHTTPVEFGAYLKSEVEKWGKVVKATGIRAD